VQERLRERRERLDRVAHQPERDARPDRERRLLEPLAGLSRIDLDPAATRLDPDPLEAEPVGAWPPAGGDGQPIAAQLRAVGEVEHVVRAVAARCARMLPEHQLGRVERGRQRSPGRSRVLEGMQAK